MNPGFKKYFLLFTIFVLTGIFFNVSYGANASCEAGGNAYPWCQAVKSAGEGAEFSVLVAEFYRIALALVGVTALGTIVYGGVLYTVSSGNASKQQDAIGWLTAAALGVVLLLGAYLLLYTINSQLVRFGPIDIKPFKTESVHTQSFSTSSQEFQGAVHSYNIDQCSPGWQQVPNSSCDNLSIQRQDPPFNRPNAPQVCCKMIGNW
jgi:hypothetical protein